MPPRAARCRRRPSQCCRSRRASDPRPCHRLPPDRSAKRATGAPSPASNPPKINEVERRLHTKSMMRLTASLRFTVLCLAANSAHAARPFFTDDARVVDKGHCQLESFYKEQRSYSGSEFWFLPACNPLGLELTVGGNRIEGERSTIFQAKRVFKGLQTNGFGLAGS